MNRPYASSCLALDRPGSDAADDMLLHKKEEDHHRKRRDGKARHDEMPLLIVLSVKIHLAQRNGDRLGKNQIWQQIVVPDPQRIKNSYCGQNGLQHRQYNRAEYAYRTAAVDPRRFLQFLRYRPGADEALDEKDWDRALQSAVDQHQPPDMSRQMHLLGRH